MLDRVSRESMPCNLITQYLSGLGSITERCTRSKSTYEIPVAVQMQDGMFACLNMLKALWLLQYLIYFYLFRWFGSIKYTEKCGV